MAGEEQSQGLTTSMPMSAPPTPAPPTPPSGAMDKGVTGADPANDPANSLMAEATRLGGPLGGIAIGAATGAAHHAESQLIQYSLVKHRQQHHSKPFLKVMAGMQMDNKRINK